MQLNPDCVRDILLAVEQMCDAKHEFRIDEDTNLSKIEFLKKYEWKEIEYHINQCNASGFFSKCTKNILGGFIIKDLSPGGHEFLQNIRNDSVFNKLKDSVKKGASLTLESLVKLAFKLAAEIALNQIL